MRQRGSYPGEVAAGVHGKRNLVAVGQLRVDVVLLSRVVGHRPVEDAPRAVGDAHAITGFWWISVVGGEALVAFRAVALDGTAAMRGHVKSMVVAFEDVQLGAPAAVDLVGVAKPRLSANVDQVQSLSLIHISEPTRSS